MSRNKYFTFKSKNELDAFLNDKLPGWELVLAQGSGKINRYEVYSNEGAKRFLHTHKDVFYHISDRTWTFSGIL